MPICTPRLRPTLPLLAACGFCIAAPQLAAPPSALAQGAQAGALEEVVVTARKRSERLQDVPIAVTAFTEADIDDAGINRPADFIGLMPNVTIVDTANVGDTQVSIRGVVSTRDAESTFAYVVDGVLVTNPNAFNETLLDVTQIEVLKGPQGALYGRNAVAGAILVTTAEPGDALRAEVAAGVGNNGILSLRGTVSGPLSDALGARLTVNRDQFDGHYRNAFTGVGDAVDYLEDTGARGRLVWNLGDATRLDLRAGLSEVSGGAINFNAVFAIPSFAALDAFDPGAAHAAFFADVNDHPFVFAFNVPGENEQQTLELSVKLDHETAAGDFSAVLAYNDLDEHLLSDGTSGAFYGYRTTTACVTARQTLNTFSRPDLFGPFLEPYYVPAPSDEDPDDPLTWGVIGPYTSTSCDGYQYQERNQSDVSAELRFSSAQDRPLRWIAGVYFAAIEREVVVTYGADTGQGFLRQPYVPADGPNPTDLLFWDEYATDVLAAFGQLEWDLSERVELAFALRFDQEDREVDNQVPATLSSGLYLHSAGAPINPAIAVSDDGVLAPIPARAETYEQLQPKLSWRWRAGEALSVYASYGVGFRSGGFNAIGTQATLDAAFNKQGDEAGFGEDVDARLLVNDSYPKEVSGTFELGLKSELLDRRVRLNAALFRTEVEDNQFFEFFAGPFGLLRAVTTIDEISVSGLEVDFRWLLGERFSVHGGLGLLESEIEENRHRPASVGNDVPQAPDITVNLGGQFEGTAFADWRARARVDLQHVGEMWFHTLQGERTPTIWSAFDFVGSTQDFSRAKRDAYTTVDLRVTLANARWELTLWGRNVTDEAHLAEVIPAPEFGGSFIHPGPRDSWGLDLSHRF